ncbi:MAG TPA: MarR family transcriptional regulator [Actinomycetales bacterium]
MDGGPERPTRPSPEQTEHWRAFLRAHAYVSKQLEADLLAQGQPPLAVYDVLVQLVEAPGRRLRMTELAEAVLLSRSGLTRLVDRMVRLGYVRREPSPDDARGVYAVISDEGVATLRVASRTHLQGICDHVVDRLGDEQLTALGQACRAMLPDQLLDPQPDQQADDQRGRRPARP